MRSLKKLFEILVILSVGMLHLNVTSCAFFADGEINNDDKSSESSEKQITSIRLTASKVSVQVGGISYLGFSTVPSYSISPDWSYDSSVISVEKQANGIVIKGLAEGESAITCTYQNKSATAIVTVSGYSENYVDTTEPYIYSDTTTMQMQPNDRETIHVSLYNGTAADINGYTWLIENPAVATIEQTGQYCTVSSLSQGYSRIKVTHSKAPYPYYIGIYVLNDINKVTFITTKNNIVKLNCSDGEKTVSVSLTNPKSENYARNFSWQITEGSEYLNITANGETCVLTPVKEGTAYLRITHPEAEYPLDITVRVVEIVENVFIEPSATRLLLSGTGLNTDSITASLVGLMEGRDYSDDDFYFEVEQDENADGKGRIVDYYSYANQISFTGKHNGSAMLYIGHPKSAKKRQVLIIAENQEADTIDASCMITTTQNYIKTKVGAAETRLLVSLKGGTEDDNMNFSWSLEQQSEDGLSDVIELITTDGKVVDSRAAAQTYTYGTAYIRPLAVGNATITVTNSKSYYPLEILVKVLDESAILDEQYYFTGEGIVKFLNSETYDYTATLRSAPESKKSKITWESDSQTLVINANGENARLSSTATGSVVSHMTVNHPDAQSPKEVLVLNADTQEELDSMKAFYSNKTYYSVNVGSTISINASQVGFTDENGDMFDFSTVASQVLWTSSDPNIASVERSEYYPLTGFVTGNKTGTAKITLSYNSVSATFTVTVYPKDVVIGEIEKSTYLTTTQNVIILQNGSLKTVSVTAVGLAASKQSEIKWESTDSSIATVSGNGLNATICAVGEGESEIKISHPDSENTLTIHVRVGSEFIQPEDTAAPYISVPNLLTILTTDSPKQLSAKLNNYSGNDSGGFSFNDIDERVAKISAQSTNGTAYIKGISSGYTEITVSHRLTDVTKKVLVVVGKTEDEIAQLLNKAVYLSTTRNVVTFTQTDENTEVKISAVNLSPSEYYDILWTSYDNSVVTVMPNGTSATLHSVGEGKAIVHASHSKSLNGIDFYVFVGDNAIAEANGSGTSSGSGGTGSSSGGSGSSGSSEASPIQISSVNVFTMTTGEKDKLLSVSLSNFSGDQDGFSFAVKDSGIAKIASQSSNGTAYIKPVAEGYTEITVSHKSTDVIKKILVVVGKNDETVADLVTKPVYLTTSNNVVALPGIGKGTLVKVNAANLDSSEFSKIRWTCVDESVASVMPNGLSATIMANGSGKTTVYATYEGSLNSVTYYVFVGEEAIAEASESGTSSSGSESSSGSSGNGGSGSSGSGSSSSGSGSSGNSGTSPEITARAVAITSVNVVSLLTSDADKQVSATLSGYSGTDTDGFSFFIKDNNVAKISSQSSNGTAYIKPLSEGYTEITVSHKATDVTKKILVVVGKTTTEITQTLESIVYLTTTDNVVRLTEGGSAVARVTAANLNTAEQQNIVWRSLDSSVASVIENGASATIIAKNPGICTVSTSYPGSVNSITFHVFVSATESGTGSSSGSVGSGSSGSGYSSSGSGSSGSSGTSPDITAKAVSITSVNIVSLLTSDADKQVSAALSGYSGTDTDGFSFSIRDSSVAKISSQSSNGIAYIKPIGEGYTEITVSHRATDVTKKILVVVGETESAVTQTLESSVYLTVANNAFFISNGSRLNVQIAANNLSQSDSSDIQWVVSDKAIASVIPNGTSAIIQGISAGQTTVKITHPKSKNELTLYVYVEKNSSATNNTAPSKTLVPIISASTDMISILKDSPNYTLTAVLVNPEDENDGLSGFSFSVEDSSVASIIAQYQSGTCYIKPQKAGQTEITITHPKSKYPKKVLVVVSNTAEEIGEIKYISTTSNVVNIGEGSTKSVSVSLENASETVIGGYTWVSEDASVASVLQTTSGTALISGNKIGSTRILVTHAQSKYTLEIIIQVIDPVAAAAMPFIQVPNPILNLVESAAWSTLTAELIGGTESDAADFIWQVYDGKDVVELYYQNGIAKIRAKKAGSAIVRVTHPKAVYPQDIRLICDAANATEYSISVSSGNIMSIRPDAGDQTITATLVNGSTSDKYNFKWSLDVYDVIDMTYAANTAIITPLREGTVTITVSHPKAAYDQQIIVKVQQYNTFGFSSVSKTVVEGQSTFVRMEVPASSVETKVSYSSENAKIAEISGTNSVCQITGTGAGSVTVHAQLIATKTNVVQASADLLVIVTAAPSDMIYINGTSGLATTFTMTLGTSKVLSAELVGAGINIADNASLEWSVPLDQKILSLAGADTTGKVSGASAYLTAEKAGETTLTVTHPKTNYSLVYHVIVPGADVVEVSLDKNYIEIEKGKNTTVKATVSSKKSSDYKLLVWSISRVNGDEIATVNGTGADGVGGQTVTIYGIKSGTVYLSCEYPGSGSVAQCQVTVKDPKSFTLDRQVIRLQPNSTKTFNYTVTPPDADINWVYASNTDGTDVFQPFDNGHDSEGRGTVTITSFKEGTGVLSGVSSYGSKVNIQVQVAWDYVFTVNVQKIAGSPEKDYTVEYKVSPSDALIEVECSKGDLFCDYSIFKADEEGRGRIIVYPKAVGEELMLIRAKNINNGDIFGEHQINLSFFYDRIDLIAEDIKDVSYSDNVQAYYSNINTQTKTITIGDGEELSFKLALPQTLSKVKIYSIEAELKNNNGSNETSTITMESNSFGNITLRHAKDIKKPGYVITEGYRPTLNGGTTYPDGTPIKIEDFASDHFMRRDEGDCSDGSDDNWQIWRVYNTKTSSELYRISGRPDNDESYYTAICSDVGELGNPDNDGWWLNVNGKAGKVYKYMDSKFIWSKVRDSSLDGRCYLESDFQSLLWYYCPKFFVKDHGDCSLDHPYGEIDVSNIKAEYTDAIPDRTVTKIDSVGKLCITVNHAGGTEKIEFSLYLETRNCACTLPKN